MRAWFQFRENGSFSENNLRGWLHSVETIEQYYILEEEACTCHNLFILVRLATERERQEDTFHYHLEDGRCFYVYIGGKYQFFAQTIDQAIEWLQELEAYPERFL